MSLFRRQPRAAARTITNRSRLLLEALEARTVPTVFLTQNFDGVTAPALPNGWTSTVLSGGANGTNAWITASNASATAPNLAASPPNSAYGNESTNPGDNVLVTPTFTPTAASTVSFNIAYSLEQSSATQAFDCAILEISTDGGTTWNEITAAGGSFTTGGYDHATISTGFQNPIMTQYAPTTGAVPNWSGTSAGFAAGTFVPQVVTLPAAAINQPTELRWREASDQGITNSGMYVDDVVVQTPPSTDLQITKTDGTNTVFTGGTTTYTITVTNAGPDPATGAKVNDTIPALIASDTWTATATGGATVGTASGTGNINNVSVNIPSGAGSVVFTVHATIGNTTGALTNTATVTAGTGATDPTPGNNSATDTDTITPPTADLGVTVSNGTTGVTAGANTTYTVTVSNAGPGAATGATVNVASTPTGAITYNNWTATYSGGATGPASGTGGITNQAINVPSGGGAIFTLHGSISTTATGTLATTATVAPPTGITDPVAANNTNTDSDAVAPPSADLAVTVNSNNVSGVVAGAPTAYTITVTNSGPSLVNAATLSNVFAPSASVASASWTLTGSTGGATGPTSGTGNLTNVPVTMPPGSAITYTLTANIASGVSGSVTNTATIAPPSGTTDPVPANNSKGDTDPVLPGGDLAVTLTNGTTAPVPGTSVTYTLVATNTGPATATGARIQGTFPAALQNVTWSSAAAGGATVVTGTGTGNIDTLSTLPAGASVTFTIHATINPTASGTLAATATITQPATGFTDPLPANNTATDSDTLKPTGDVSITVTDNLTSITAGQNDSYTIVVSNTGPSTATGTAISVPFPGLTGVTWTAAVTGGATATASGTGTITGTVTLPAGSTVTYTATGMVPKPAFGTLTTTGTATVATGFTDTTPANNTATDTTTIIRIGGPLYVIGAGPGGGPHVKVFYADTGALKFSFYAFAPTFTGGVHVALGDVNGDGQQDIIVAAGAGGGPHVRVFDGYTGALIREFFAYAPTFTGGVNVAVGDVNHDGYADIITGAGLGGGPHVKVFSGKDGSLLREFMAFGSAVSSKQFISSDQVYLNGITVAAGDVNNDGFADIIVGAGRGHSPEVRVFDGATGGLSADFLAFDRSFLGGVTVASGDINGDGKADIVVGAMAGWLPQVRVFSGVDDSLLTYFNAYNAGFGGGVTVAVHTIGFGTQADIITGTGPGGGPDIEQFVPGPNTTIRGFFGYDPAFVGGVFVG